MASANGHGEVVEFLLKKGADINAQNSKGQTPLHMACISGKEGVVDALLVKHGGSVSVVDDLGMVPASYAAMFGHIGVVEKLYRSMTMYTQQEQFSSNAKSRAVYSPLHMACLGGDTVVVKFILDFGKTHEQYSLESDCNNSIKVSPLHCAALSGNTEIVKMLLALGSDSMGGAEKDVDGCTPLDHFNCTIAGGDQDSDQHKEMASLLSVSSSLKNATSNGKKQARGFPMQSKREERRSKIQSWIRMAASAIELENVLQEYDESDRKKIIPIVIKAKELQLQIDVHSAYSALRADLEFQEDMRDDETVAIVDQLRKDSSKYEYYMHQPKVGSVLAKLQRLHGNLKSLGQSTLMLDAVLVKRREQGAVKERDAIKRKALLEQLDACVEAIDRILVFDDGNDTNIVNVDKEGKAITHARNDDDDVRLKDVLIRNGIMLFIVIVFALAFKYYYG